jgi:hypothetical protein
MKELFDFMSKNPFLTMGLIMGISWTIVNSFKYIAYMIRGDTNILNDE